MRPARSHGEWVGVGSPAEELRSRVDLPGAVHRVPQATLAGAAAGEVAAACAHRDAERHADLPQLARAGGCRAGELYPLFSARVELPFSISAPLTHPARIRPRSGWSWLRSRRLSPWCTNRPAIPAMKTLQTGRCIHSSRRPPRTPRSSPLQRRCSRLTLNLAMPLAGIPGHPHFLAGPARRASAGGVDQVGKVPEHPHVELELLGLGRQ